MRFPSETSQDGYGRFSSRPGLILDSASPNPATAFVAGWNGTLGERTRERAVSRGRCVLSSLRLVNDAVSILPALPPTGRRRPCGAICPGTHSDWLFRTQQSVILRRLRGVVRGRERLRHGGTGIPRRYLRCTGFELKSSNKGSDRIRLFC